MRYQYNANLIFDGTVRTDMYDFIIEDRLGSGGLETDFYSMEKTSLREIIMKLGQHILKILQI